MNYIPQETYAAVDLGSNSFHMLVTNYSEGQLQVVDNLKEMVKLASGLDHKNRLTEESMDVALECLQRFGQWIREIPRTNVRAVGTNTLRKATNREDFLKKASDALGLQIEVITGQEEARLIYQGVSHNSYNIKDKRLVVDIGGGSTEVIIGRGFDVMLMESLYIGCANICHRFFTDDEVNSKMMKKAILYARQELEAIENIYKNKGWDIAIGSSGTIQTVNAICKAKGWVDTGISIESLGKLKDLLLEIGKPSKFDFPDLSSARRPVFIGGVAILCAIFESLKIDHMQVSDGALREGLIHDLIGRDHDKDVRDTTMTTMMQRYTVDGEQAIRVSDTAGVLLDETKKTWDLKNKSDRKLLLWAASIHEIGISIAHAQHHYHGAYLLSHSDMPGFTRKEQQELSMLVRAHRRKFPVNEVKKQDALENQRIRYLCILLRLAVLLNRSRLYTSLPSIKTVAAESSLSIGFPKHWLEEHPLTQVDLETEAELLKNIGFTLTYS
jgi:exopolyphosphatase/guanosine-5'-triphosphate,3'-diphosphate pyrophosphatase